MQRALSGLRIHACLIELCFNNLQSAGLPRNFLSAANRLQQLTFCRPAALPMVLTRLAMACASASVAVGSSSEPARAHGRPQQHATALTMRLLMKLCRSMLGRCTLHDARKFKVICKTLAARLG